MAAQKSPLAAAWQKTRMGFATAIVFSFFINLLALVGPIYMLQVYDRVLASRNETTLLFLTILAAFLLLVFAILERCRSAVLVRLGALFDQSCRLDIFNLSLRGSLMAPSAGHSQALRDLDTMREFGTGSGLISFCDVPWVPIFIAGCFLLHPLYGYIALGGGVVIFCLALGNELMTKSHLKAASQNSVSANSWVQATFRNAEALSAMGMLRPLRERWSNKHDEVLHWQARASDRAGVFMAGTKFTRAFLQVAILGSGALLVIEGESTAGAMIAASIMMGRALAPVESIVGQWKGFSAARNARERVNMLFKMIPQEPERMLLPAPTGAISLESVIAAPPQQRVPTLRGINLRVGAGQVLAVVGPSGAGKSTLARVLVGVWPTLSGAVRYDGSELSHWDKEQIGGHIGYLPQDIELFDGTIAENIGRFKDLDESKVIAAAQMAGVFELIQAMPEGFNTMIGERGQSLSGGQRQRIGLARALYDMPAVSVLDEPNSNLDAEGEVALIKAIEQMKQAGKTVVLITHKPNILNIVDLIAIIVNGQLQSFGEREKILPTLMGTQVSRLPNQAAKPAGQVVAQQPTPANPVQEKAAR